MRAFAKFPVRFWARKSTKEIKQMGSDKLLISIYLQTNTHSNMIGLYHLPLEYISIDTGLAEDQVHEVMESLKSINYCQYDDMNEYVWIVDFAADQTGLRLKEGDKRVRAIHKLLADMPELSFKDAFYEKYAMHYHLPNEDGEIPSIEVPHY